MILSLEQVKSITRGAAAVKENECGLSFHRFNEKQADYYKNCGSESLCRQIFHSASVCLDFYTDSNSFEFDYSVLQSGAKFYYFDVYVDGVMVKQVGEFKACLNKGTVAVDVKSFAEFENREHRITVWLPNLSRVTLSNIKLDDGASFRKAEPKKRILTYGDSITQGYYAEAPSMSYINRMARHFDADVRNLGIGGEKFVPGLLDPELDFSPDFITVAYGTNDWMARTYEEFTVNCDAFIEGLAKIYPDTFKFIILPIWRGAAVTKQGKANWSLMEASAYIKSKAEEYDMTVLDGYNYVPRVSNFFYDDVLLHPNDLGFGEYASKLIADIEKYI